MKLPSRVQLVEIDGEFQLRAVDYIPPNDYIGIAMVDHPKLGKIYTPLGAYLKDSQWPNCTFLIREGVWGLWNNNDDIYIGDTLSVDKNLFRFT